MQGCPSRHRTSFAHGVRARRVLARRVSSWMWTRPSARSSADRNRGPVAAARTRWATTRLSRPAADTGEVLHARLRKGPANTQRGARRFIEELVARVRRADASGEIVCRFDSRFWSGATIAALGRLDVRYTMAVRTNTKGITEAIVTFLRFPGHVPAPGVVRG